MFRLRSFLLEWFHLLVVGDNLTGRIFRWCLWAIGLGILTFLREPLHILVWNGKLLGGFLPQYREPTVVDYAWSSSLQRSTWPWPQVPLGQDQVRWALPSVTLPARTAGPCPT
jgi:hypothetical protein